MHLPLLPSILLVSWHEISFPGKRKRQYELCRLPPCLLYVIILYHLRRSCKWLYGIKTVPLLFTDRDFLNWNFRATQFWLQILPNLKCEASAKSKVFPIIQETPLDNQEGFHSSAPCRTWTGDLRITNASLYQLSQGSILIWKMLWKTQSNFRWPVRESNPGLRRERASSWPLDQQAVCFIIESRRRDSNTRPLRPERSALPNWATPRLHDVV